MNRSSVKALFTIILVCVLSAFFLYAGGNIGISASGIEPDIRTSQKIKDSWTVDGNISDSIAAFISYPQDETDHTFSVYINRPGMSFGYFFRAGGNSIETEKYIAEFSVDGYNERAFISMNEQKTEKVEIDNGNAVQIMDIDSNKPFAIVLPVNEGSITFFDTEGNVVEYRNYPL